MEAFVANLLVDKIGVSNSFANALLGTVLALAFHPIKNRMEHTLKRIGPGAAPSLTSDLWLLFSDLSVSAFSVSVFSGANAKC
jgi:hypothetical protein